jgi:hypothetical protein
MMDWKLMADHVNVQGLSKQDSEVPMRISTAPSMTGPSYIYRNLVVNMGCSYNNETGSAVKAGGGPDGIFGMQFFFNNTMDSDAAGPTNVTYASSSEYHSVSRNNIFVTRKAGLLALKNIFADERAVMTII